jgi:hypothetical protein
MFFKALQFEAETKTSTHKVAMALQMPWEFGHAKTVLAYSLSAPEFVPVRSKHRPSGFENRREQTGR